MIDRRHQLFRYLFLAATLPLLALSVTYAYLLANLGTVQNDYQATRSRLYVVNDIREVEMVRILKRPFSFQQNHKRYIQQGDLVVAVNGVSVANYQEVLDAVSDMNTTDRIRVTVQRPTRLDYFLEFEMPLWQWEKSSLWETPPTVYVWSVPRGGASHMAGIIPGDLIHEINGRGFENQDQADRLVRGTLRGRTILFGIIRKNNFLNVQVTMASLTVPVPLIIYQLVGFLWLGAGWCLGILRPQFKAARLLGSGFFLVGVAFMLYENRGDMHAFFSPTHLLLLGAFSLYLGLACLIHGSYYFPRESKTLLKTSWFRLMSYPLAFLAATWTFFAGSSGLGFGLAIMLVPQLVIRLRFHRKRNKQQATLEQYILNGVTFGVVSIVSWSLLKHNMTQSWDLIVRSLTGMVVLSSFLVTIARFRLLGIAVKRGLQYIILTSLWSAIAAGSFLFLLGLLANSDLNMIHFNLTPRNIEFHDQPLSPESQARNHKMTLMLIALMLAYLFALIGRQTRSFLRNKFHRGAYDYLMLSDQLNQLLAGNRQLADLTSELTVRLARLMFIKQVGIVLFHNQQVVCTETTGLAKNKLARLCEKNGQFLYKALSDYRAEFSLRDLNQQLSGPLGKLGLIHGFNIYSKDLLLGCILTGEKLSEAPYGEKDFRFFNATAQQAAVAIENALLYEQLTQQERLQHELELARHIQISSLPQQDPASEDLDISGTSIPALEVGGDYYAYFGEGRPHLTVLVGDVSGKGTSAALYMSKMQGIFSTLVEDQAGPRELFVKANKILYREMERNSFVTAICGRFNPQTQTLDLARAGHLPLFHYCATTEQTHFHKPGGLGLGLESGVLFEKLMEEQQLVYQPGDIFLFLTDGLTEVVGDHGDMIGEETVLRWLKGLAHKPAAEIRNAILEEVNAMAPGLDLHDDQTIVVVKSRSNVQR